MSCNNLFLIFLPKTIDIHIVSLFDSEKFEKVEKHYKNIVIKRFPNTKIIDTTNNSPEETVQEILQDNNFKRDL